MKRRTIILYASPLLLTVIEIAALGICISTNPNNAEAINLKNENTKNQAMINYYVRKTNNLSVQNELDKISADNINVSTKLSDITKRIKDGIDLTYNKTKNDKDYSELKKKLPQLVGESFSKKLTELDEPAVNQSGQSQFPYGSTTSVLVTFGRYNYRSVEVPIYVSINYETPALKDKDGKDKKLKGQDLFVLSYNLKENKLNLSNYVKGINQNE